MIEMIGNKLKLFGHVEEEIMVKKTGEINVEGNWEKGEEEMDGG